MPKPKIQVGDIYEDEFGNTFEVDKVTFRKVYFFGLASGKKFNSPISEFLEEYEQINIRKPVDSTPQPMETPDAPVPAPVEPATPAPEPTRPATVADIARALGLKTNAGIEAFKVAVQNVQLLDRKQQDYGPNNIAAFGELGVLVRANDKIERLKNLHKTGRLNDPQNESVDDSWMDLSNYGIIAILIRRGLWG